MMGTIAVAPSAMTIALLRSISRTGFAYEETKSLCNQAGCALVDDEPDLGYTRYELRITASDDSRRILSVLHGSESQPFANVPLFFFEDYEDGRVPLDEAFDQLSAHISRCLGDSSSSGTYCYDHEPEWPYKFAGWKLSDATLQLVQDQHDIQFGMDVTLWVRPVGTEIAVPIDIG